MLRIRYSSRFKKDYKAVKRRGYDTRLLEEVLNILSTKQTLPPKYLDHALAGNYKGYRECHITPDWLLIYQYETLDDGEQQLVCVRTGTHSDFFQ